ncbi:MAG TPA: peptidoglycan DD-metalloendopeptidase family protein, partial [Thermomicrobiales bacterium]|nr:peptidoglycan DD-metalloendopeptidase family protein [Thermomicrobiales bacterium]
PSEESTSRDQSSADFSSVRPRGLEAPVDLIEEVGQGAEHEPVEQIENTDLKDEPRDERRDPGDGPVRDRDEASKEERNRAPQGMRVWPMPADSYTFTQQFGCVPQLGSLYFPGEGCPADAPVIHTGVDLAAPEGTPFYAAASGWVTLADYDRPTADANTRIIIQHDGRNERYATDYLHWVASYVKEGDYVQAGDPIGEVGNVGFSTGPHLHFSVTDLDTGEHIDPLRWLPEEPGLEGYVSRRPTAQLRLPPGTTAGQPESADPNPPPPPVRKDVPKNPPDESGGRDQSDRRDGRKGDERRGEKSGESATDKSDRSGKKRHRDDVTSSADSPETAGEATKERDRSRERDRTRERTKDGSRSEADDSGEDGRTRENREDSKSGTDHRDRNATNDTGDNQGRKDDSDERDRSDDGEQSDSGGGGERREERQDQDHASDGQDKRNGGDGKNRAETTDQPAGGGDTADSTTGDSGDEGASDRGKRDRREKN